MKTCEPCFSEFEPDTRVDTKPNPARREAQWMLGEVRDEPEWVEAFRIERIDLRRVSAGAPSGGP